MAELKMPKISSRSISNATNSLDGLFHKPRYCVLHVRTTLDPHERPVLGTSDSQGRVAIPIEPVAWVKALLFLHTQATATRWLKTIGRLYEYASLSFANIELDGDLLQTVVWNYLGFRIGDRQPGDLDTGIFAHWKPVKLTTAQEEFRAIRSYFRFCEKTYGASPLFKVAFTSENPCPRIFAKDEKLRDRDFFAHLRPQRERWRRLAGEPLPGMPHLTNARPDSSRLTSSGRTMPRHEIDLIIDGEKNSVFRCLWLLLAFGGIRVSEALNIWQVDVMPGRYGPHFDAAIQDTLFILLAHPELSPFTGDFVKVRGTRAQFLNATYGLIPRNLYPEKHALRAGWKGMLESSRRWRAAWIYWIDNERAKDFAVAAQWVRKIHQEHQTSRVHPYFFVNGAHSTYVGDPLKYRNVEKAFYRACRRVGLEPHEGGRNLHGFRHFYKRTLEFDLKVDRATLQLLMHHRSVTSQDHYGQSAADVHEILQKALIARALQ